jgi:hypothetical protein
VNDEDSLRSDIHQALDPVSGRTPDLLPGIVPRLRPVSRRRPLLAIGQALAVLGIGLVVGAIVIAMHRPHPAPARVTTSPIAPIVAGPGADIAWVTSQTGTGADVVTGIDPTGRVVGRITGSVDLRSPDGAHLYALGEGGVEVFSATDGHREQTIPLRTPGGAAIEMLSPDGRYLAVAGGSPAMVELVDLSTGRSVATAVGGALPAFGAPLVVGPKAQHVYVVGESIVELAFDGTSLRVEQRTSAPALPCNGLVIGGGNSAGGLPFRVLADGRTLVTFCPADGRVTWFDLDGMTVIHELTVPQANPFWVSPVFSPDGNTLYLHEGGTGRLTVVDLVHKRVVRSTKVATAGGTPLAWLGSLLVMTVEAGAIDRTAAVSPDGSWLYAVGDFGAPGGVYVVHLPELGVRGRWLPDVSFASAWVSADGQAIYLLSQDGVQLRVLRTDGSSVASVTLPANTFGFVVPTVP